MTTTFYIDETGYTGEDLLGTFAKRLFDAGPETLLVGGLWPSPDVTPEALGTKGLNANEWVSTQLRSAKGPSE